MRLKFFAGVVAAAAAFGGIYYFKDMIIRTDIHNYMPGLKWSTSNILRNNKNVQQLLGDNIEQRNPIIVKDKQLDYILFVKDGVSYKWPPFFRFLNKSNFYFCLQYYIGGTKGDGLCLVFGERFKGRIVPQLIYLGDANEGMNVRLIWSAVEPRRSLEIIKQYNDDYTKFGEMGFKAILSPNVVSLKFKDGEISGISKLSERESDMIERNFAFFRKDFNVVSK